MKHGPLHNLTIVITRPELQSKPLCDTIHTLGGHPIAIPSLRIAAINLDKQITALTPNINAENIAIFVSANAVFHSKALWQSVPKNKLPHLIAIGPGTANALNSIHLPVGSVPTTFNSEGLLSLNVLQHIKDKTIYLCSGADSRPLIESTLTTRKALVVPLVCYRRLKAALSPHQITQLTNSPPHFVVTTSRSCLENWHALLKTAHLETLLNTPTLIIDKKYRTLATELGFTSLLVSENATDASIIATLSSAKNRKS